MLNSDSRTGGLISKQGPTRPNAQENQYPKTSTTANLDSNDLLWLFPPQADFQNRFFDDSCLLLRRYATYSKQ